MFTLLQNCQKLVCGTEKVSKCNKCEYFDYSIICNVLSKCPELSPDLLNYGITFPLYTSQRAIYGEILLFLVLKFMPIKSIKTLMIITNFQNNFSGRR